MSFRIIRPGLAGLVGLLVLTTVAVGDDSYTAGQKIEVREGDKWSGATVLSHEGRRYKVHYNGADAATDEWVETDRMRVPPPGSSTTKPVRLGNADYARGDTVEFKSWKKWKKGTVFKKSGAWTMIYTSDFHQYQWVQPWRIRKVGSTTEVEGIAPDRMPVDKLTAAPAFDPPGPGEDDPRPAETDPGSRLRRHGETAAADPKPAAEPVPGVKPPVDPDGRLSRTTGPGDVPIVKADLSSGHDVEPTHPTGGIAVDTATPVTPPHMIALNHGPPKPGINLGLVINPQGRAAVLTFVPSGRDQPVMIQRVDLPTQDATKVMPLCKGVWPVAISNDGKRLITRSDDFSFEGHWRLDLWSLDSAAPKPLISFRPYDPAGGGADAVIWCHYVDSTHILTCSASYVITCWEVTDTGVKEVYTLQGDHTVSPQVTTSGKLLVVGFDTRLCVCDALTGNCLVRSAVPNAAKDMIVNVRSDLKKVAMIGHDRMILMDMADDLQADHILNLGLPQIPGATQSVDWVRPNLLLIDKRWLFDIDHYTYVWRYTIGSFDIGDANAAFVGDRLWLLGESGNSAVGGAGQGLFTSVPMPTTEVLDADKKLPDGQFALRPGMSVTLDVNVNASQEERQRIIDRITSQLKEADVTVADNQPLHLVAETKNGDTRSQTFLIRNYADGSQHQETLSATATIYRVAFVLDGKTLWETTSQSGGYLPNFFTFRKDQSASDVIAGENKVQLGFFMQATVPTWLLKPQAEESIGTSPLGTVSGRSRNRK